MNSRLRDSIGLSTSPATGSNVHRSSPLTFGGYIFICGRPVSVAFFKRPVWEQTIGKQSNERPLQKNSAVPDASGKTFRKSVRSSINLLQPSPGVRYSEFLTLSILRVKNSLPLTVSADTTTPRSLSLETRPLISCLRYASPNRRPGDCKIGVGLDKWGHTRPLYLPTHLV